MRGAASPPAAARLCVLALLVTGGAGCSTEFEPIEPGDLGFSVSGYLDPGLDTQWVRVGRIRESLEPDPEGFQAEVTLVEVETGRRWPLRDSVFTFFNRYRAVNVWTDAPIEAGRTYRLEIEGADGQRASAEATPPPRPETLLRLAPTADPARLTLYDVGRVENVVITYTCGLPDGTAYDLVFRPLRVDRRGRDGRTVDVNVYWYNQTFTCRFIEGGKVVAASLQVTILSENWPDLQGVDFDGLAVPSSNVEGGEGFFGGATTLRVPTFEGVPTTL